MLNSFVGGMYTVWQTLADNLIFDGCPYCKDQGYNVNYKTKYNYSYLAKGLKQGKSHFPKGVGGIDSLPIKDNTVLLP